jgi:hypothetical protein
MKKNFSAAAHAISNRAMLEGPDHCERDGLASSGSRGHSRLMSVPGCFSREASREAPDSGAPQNIEVLSSP